MSTDNERPTPRTDAAILNGTGYQGKDTVLADFARELERELIVSVNTVVETTNQIIELTAERDAYKAKVKELIAHFH